MRVVETMGSRAEELRKQTLAGGGATARHSMNQKTTGYIIRMQERGFDRKAEKSERRKRKEVQFLREFPGVQFNRALGQMLNGTATKESIGHVFDNADKHEKVIDIYKTEKGTEVIVTIVDFTPPNSKNLS
jgi:hypothetical protein